MLAGRESLIRLVGKRKRILSSPLSQLLRPQPNSEEKGSAAVGDRSSLVKQGGEEEVASTSNDGNKASDFAGKQKKEAGNDGSLHDSEWVSCPVCGASIRGTDYVVNSHLDLCLTRGTKRKLTQRTLLQLNFCQISKSKASSEVLQNPNTHVSESELVGKEVTSSNIKIRTGSIKDREKGQCASDALDNNTSSLQEAANALTENIGVRSPIHCNMLPRNKRLLKIDASRVEDANFEEVLETFIVGRKFHDDVDLQQGSGLSLLRDPQNAKDKHAIKVLSVDSGSGQMLGYLPRELAKSLSPLIDNQDLQCEGSVVSVPENPFDAVPIQLVCKKDTSDQVGYDGDRNFEFFWANVKRVSEYAKTNPPTTAKYQQNFCIMIKDVLNNHSHLLTNDEKSLLGSFDSLGDDAQRLFVRIYTRKGPWFRMSNISYSEISDVRQASEELQFVGYICLFNSNEDIIKYDMKEILELLTVFEMKELSNFEISKGATNCARRQELINFLFSAYEDRTCCHLPEMILKRVGRCIKISSAIDTLLWRVQVI